MVMMGKMVSAFGCGPAAPGHHRGIILRYALVTVLVLVTGLVGGLLLDRLVQTERGYADLISLTGRQRMLAQRIARRVVEAGRTQSADARRAVSYMMWTDILEMWRSHATLVAGLPDQGAAARALYFGPTSHIDADLSRFLTAAATNGEDVARQADAVVDGLDLIVAQLADESRRTADRLRLAIVSTLPVAALVLAYSAFAIFLPMLRRIRSEKEREESAAARLRGIFDSAVDAIVTIDGDDRIVEFSQSAQKLFGYTEEEALGRLAGDLLVPIRYRDRHAALVRRFRDSDGEGLARRREAILQRRGGAEFPAEFNSASVVVRGQTLLTSFIRDVTRRRIAEETTRKLSQAVEQSPVSIIITGLDGAIEYVNQRFTESTGYARAEVLGQNPRLLKSGLFTSDDYKALWETITAGREWHGELNNKRKDGSLFWERATISPVRDGKNRVTHFLAIKEDITRFKAYEERLVHQATYDALTGLPNRVLALDRLQQAIAQAQRGRHMTAVMFLDLDDFKQINDTFGHLTGDKLLVAVAHRIKTQLRQADTLARLGGDEFLIILHEVEHGLDGEMVANKILASLEEPFVLDDLQLYVGASIGITLYPADAASAETLLCNADSAMYAAKRAGRNLVRFFSAEMAGAAEARVKLESRLRAGFKARELFLVYQPMVASGSGEVAGVEALLRWRHGDMGLVPPDLFIPAAEHTGLIIPITEWVLGEACRTVGAWQKRVGRPIRLAVNVSSQSFRSLAIVETLRALIARNDLAPGTVELEITERVMLEDNVDTRHVMAELSALGVRLSVDDFGTGYSSLSYIKRFPFSTVKIDKAFVQTVGAGAEGRAIATAIIRMAKSLGLETVGEGVEDEEQDRFLRAEGCDYAQGYLLGRPMPADAILSLLEAGDHRGPVLRRGAA